VQARWCVLLDDLSEHTALRVEEWLQLFKTIFSAARSAAAPGECLGNVERRSELAPAAVDALVATHRISPAALLVCDGLTRLPDAVTAVWPRTVVQTCLFRLLRNSFRYAARQDWAEVAKVLKPVPFDSPIQTRRRGLTVPGAS